MCLNGVRMRCLLVVCLCLGLASRSSGQAIYESEKSLSEFKRALEYVYNVEEEPALRLIDSLKKVWPKHPAPDLLSALQMYWAESIISSESNRYKDFIRVSNQAAQKANQLWREQQLPEALLIEISIRGLLAERYASNGKYLDAIREAKIVYKYLPFAQKLRKVNADFYLVVGLYNYFIEKYPEEYPIYKAISIFFKSGNKSLGIQQVDSAAHIGILTRAEAMTYLMEIYLNYERKPKRSLVYLRQLHESFPKNPFYAARLAESYLRMGNFEETPPLIDQVTKSPLPYCQLYAHYLKGYVEEKQHRRLQSAHKYYQKAIFYGKIFQYKGSLIKGECYLGMARIAEQRAHKEQAHQYYSSAYEVTESTAIRKQAQKGITRTQSR